MKSSDIYDINKKRQDCLDKYLKQHFLKNKSLLDIGCGIPYLLDYFLNKCSNIVMYDINDQLLNNNRLKYKNCQFEKFDAENSDLNRFFDVIINFSLLNHINNLDCHLNDVCKNCNYVILDLEICDSIDDDFIIKSRPSQNYIEKILSNNNFKFKVIKDSSLNTNIFKYDWIIQNTNNYNNGHNRFWICWRDGFEIPIKDEFIPQTSIILQGIINNNIDIINTISHYQKFGNIILSLYKDFEDINLINKVLKKFPNIEIIYNNYNEYRKEIIKLNKFINNNYKDNCYYQIKSSLLPFRKIISKYVVKTRIDHFYESIDDFMLWGRDQNKIISSSIYVRGSNYARYHLSDHLFQGKTKEINLLFNLALNNYNPGCPEINIWRPYIFYLASLENIHIDSLNDDDYSEWMAKKFYIYCINRNKSYKIKCNLGIKSYIKDVDTSNYIEDIDKTTDTSKLYFLVGCDII